MSRRPAWLLVLALLALYGAAAYVALRGRAQSGRGMPAYSVYSEGEDGLGEAVHVLRAAGWRPVALTRPVQQTPYTGLLVVTEPRGEGFLPEPGGLTPAEARGLLRWVERGNTLLLSTRTNTLLHRALKLVVTEGAGGAGGSFVAVRLAPGPYARDVERLSVEGGTTLSEPKGARVLWRVGDSPGAVLIERGAGRVIVTTAPELLTRRGLVRADGEPRDDNVLFLMNVAGLHARDATVYFDESHHGFRAGVGFWSYLGSYGHRWALLPPLIVVGVVLWRWAVRLGPAVPRPRPARADAVDFASALARLYQRAGARRLMARVLVRDFLDALTRHLRLRRTALPALILSAWRQQDTGPPARRLEGLLRGVAELRKAEVDDRRLLHWARAFDEFVQDMRA
jgi:hypothetical protein